MQITENTIELDSRWFSAERDVSRTKGLHLSHVIDFIEFLEQKREAFKGDFTAAAHAYAAGGFCWERVLERLIETDPVQLWEWLFGRVLSEPENPKIIRPGEQCLPAGHCTVCQGTGRVFVKAATEGPKCDACNGTGFVLVYLTPDGYHIDDLLLEEWKYTTKSARDIDLTGKKFRRWTKFQIPCYLKSLALDTCRLRVYFARGDYTDGTPIWKEFILKYSQQEIDESWGIIVQHAQIMRERGLA